MEGFACTCQCVVGCNHSHGRSGDAARARPGEVDGRGFGCAAGRVCGRRLRVAIGRGCFVTAGLAVRVSGGGAFRLLR